MAEIILLAAVSDSILTSHQYDLVSLPDKDLDYNSDSVIIID